MSKTVAQKIIENHIVEGKAEPGEQIGLRIDHTLTQDATGTLAYLEFEAIGVPRVKTKLSLSFVDHNMLQNDFRNADDHRYLQDVAAKYGIVYSRPGNGISHQVYLERFAKPGVTLLGSDSHTPNAGGMSMIAIGAGGLDVALAMAGEPFYLEMPTVEGIKLTGSLQPFVTAKDVILKVLQTIGVKGGVGKILEYYGSGVETLSVPERATITNMGTETGATTSVFPSGEETRTFLKAQGREDQWMPLEADNAKYDEVIDLELSDIEPLITLPHSPDNVKAIREVEGTAVDQVCIGSCTNSSLHDLKMVAALLKGKKIDDNVSLTISPGSRQVLENLAASGDLVDLVKAGARIIENACGPCIGIGQAPPTNGVSLRTFNRNFKGRSGTQSAKVYLVSPESAVAAALHGEITDPRKLGKYPRIELPEKLAVNNNMFIFPRKKAFAVNIVRGPNIRPLPSFNPLRRKLAGEVLLRLGDNVSTDDILPGGSEIMSLRSNIPEISKFTFCRTDATFAERAMKSGGGFVVGGENYGQGSSREHAALAPKYLGVKAVISKSFARIHMANLVNFGILPLTFVEDEDYDDLAQGDLLEMDTHNLGASLCVKNNTRKNQFPVELGVSDQEKAALRAGGRLAAAKKNQTKQEYR